MIRQPRSHRWSDVLDPAAVPAPEIRPTKGMKSVTHLLDEYSRLTIAVQKARVVIERVIFPLFQVS